MRLKSKKVAKSETRLLCNCGYFPQHRQNTTRLVIQMGKGYHLDSVTYTRTLSLDYTTFGVLIFPLKYHKLITPQIGLH